MTTNRPKVQRYDNMGCPEEICRVDTMCESDDGYYVVHEDYEAMQAECEKLRKDAERLKARVAELAAPDVRGEPVYLYRRLGLNDFVTCDFTRYTELTEKPKLFETKILYTAPQPAEQKPVSHDWDDQDKCRRCGDRDWYASATCTPKPQPELALAEDEILKGE